MKKASSAKPDPLSSSEEDLLPEYRFDYRKARPNRFAARTVVLDEDVAKVFTTSESVNRALRALIEALPEAGMRKRG